MPVATITEGTRTPWGRADYVQKIIDGIWIVSTPGHGGVKLDRQHNTKVDRQWRQAGGWYEEDCEANIALATFPEAFDLDEDKLTSVHDALKNWYPDDYEIVYNTIVTGEESYSRRKENFLQDTAEKFVVASAWGDWHELVPEGNVGVLARREADGTEVYRLVDAVAYKDRNNFGYVLDGTESVWSGPN